VLPNISIDQLITPAKAQWHISTTVLASAMNFLLCIFFDVLFPKTDFNGVEYANMLIAI
jgi:hypothetical protein